MKVSSQSSFADVSIDKVREFWNARPCNLRHSPAPVGSKEYFDQVEARKYFIESHIPQFAEFERWKGKRVLEIGCGIGTDTINFLRAGATVTAVDLSEESIKIARARAELFGLSERVKFIHGDAELLRSLVPPSRYDLVYSFGVIHHTPHPERVIDAIKDYVVPNAGEFRMMVYSRISYKLFWLLHEQNIWNMGRIDEVLGKNSEAQFGCPVTYSYLVEQIPDLLQGFTVKSISKAHIFTWNIEEYRNYRYVKDPAWANVSEEELAALEKELGWHMLVRARLLP